MVQGIYDIKWYRKNQKIDSKYLVELNKIPFNLPKNFIDILEKNNGGRLDYEFHYFDMNFEEILCNDISTIYGLTPKVYHDDIVVNYIDPPEFFPKGLVAFGSSSGDDQICFDYRADSTTDNPPIVCWSCGATEGRDVSFIANNFDEFLQILKESD